jgi:hypothetical protein
LRVHVLCAEGLVGDDLTDEARPYAVIKALPSSSLLQKQTLPAVSGGTNPIWTNAFDCCDDAVDFNLTAASAAAGFVIDIWCPGITGDVMVGSAVSYFPPDCTSQKSKLMMLPVDTGGTLVVRCGLMAGAVAGQRRSFITGSPVKKERENGAGFSRGRESGAGLSRGRGTGAGLSKGRESGAGF